MLGGSLEQHLDHLKVRLTFDLGKHHNNTLRRVFGRLTANVLKERRILRDGTTPVCRESRGYVTRRLGNSEISHRFYHANRAIRRNECLTDHVLLIIPKEERLRREPTCPVVPSSHNVWHVEWRT